MQVVLLWCVSVLLLISGGVNIFAVSALIRKDRQQIQRRERDWHIAELERELDINTPALTSAAQSINPLTRLLAVVIGIWVADRSRRRW